MDPLIWLTVQRDAAAAARQEAFARGDIAAANAADGLALHYYEAITEITVLRNRVAVFAEVILKRIIVANREST